MTVTDAPSQTVIELNGLSKQFGNQVILDDFALTVRKGEFVALLGRSGTGKTTLLRILAGLEDATSGHLRITPRSSVVFQEPRLIQAQRVWKNVVLSTSRSDEVYRRALDALTEVGLADKAKAWPKSLSGGEAQRVGLARALFRSPELLLLDEPFGALDAFTRRTAQDLVTTLWQEHQVGVLLVTHDIEEAVLLADRIVVLGHGTIQADIPVHLDRPRDVTSAEFNDIKRAVLNSLAIPAPEAQQDSAGQ
ncbi:ABC transporter ATP-binding protein [Mycolicibacterium smegmatis]|uniref:Aliphatic sulfonates import ATP-binding protein ssuB n=3 Tax=Mycolicibacterium smegmatis TaxID=1772 RepID=I7GDS7_MYCS2|nr:ABC transporter ATP-binding protein [Mycolicibacterium smegmatis]ABK74194.1 putative aliphatic sulfonates transport ATP-binding protein SsuB [Mycolicibacterium smegmatis MC2 155]AFP40929.1 Aliphatic sulfonates import ATP-binding protein ssuB [Mycolicibacterium smegmatis MC2 155]AIU09656.1 sulfonate ABC transporter ATP-binding protein [Mycolicibacterium smegmatis MC2 155]AIU16281.1 sulfonate ABC transporter ATP-binding protein [Mycolicibacterium smegmatis]AIU22904.1 sulfonate ABC transporter